MMKLIRTTVTGAVVFLLPIGISRAQSHSLAGLVWCCLPVGLAVYLLFHWLLKAPLIDLLPHYAYSRLHPYARPAAAIRLGSTEGRITSRSLEMGLARCMSG